MSRSAVIIQIAAGFCKLWYWDQRDSAEILSSITVGFDFTVFTVDQNKLIAVMRISLKVHLGDFEIYKEAGAIKKIRIVAEGSMVYVEVNTGAGYLSVKTDKGSLKTWASIDSAAKWVRLLGIGYTQLDFSKWQPSQRGMLI